MDENQIGKEVVDAAVKIHRAPGPGLLESVYEAILAKDLFSRGLQVQRQAPAPIEYEGIRFEERFRADLVVKERVILELKSVEHLSKTHFRQWLTHLKLKRLRLGFLLNFNAALMKDGIARVINGLEDEKPGFLGFGGEKNK